MRTMLWQRAEGPYAPLRPAPAAAREPRGRLDLAAVPEGIASPDSDQLRFDLAA